MFIAVGNGGMRTTTCEADCCCCCCCCSAVLPPPPPPLAEYIAVAQDCDCERRRLGDGEKRETRLRVVVVCWDGSERGWAAAEEEEEEVTPAPLLLSVCCGRVVRVRVRDDGQRCTKDMARGSRSRA